MKPGETRRAVLLRDGDCMARSIDPEAGPCYDRWGNAIPGRVPLDDLEADFVRRGALGARHERPEDHVALCPGHHRGAGPSRGIQWATAHRDEMRRWLDGRYDR